MKLGKKKTVCPFVHQIEYSDTWTSVDRPDTKLPPNSHNVNAGWQLYLKIYDYNFSVIKTLVPPGPAAVKLQSIS